SNFMLWQLAYSEFYFSEVLWPDFDKLEVRASLSSYAERERRYGGRLPEVGDSETNDSKGNQLA
ncbi:MAG: undecaprenyl diphosphate synthase, partial [Bermanella sp.]